MRSHLDRLGLTLGVVFLLALAGPALAAAETYVVNTTQDGLPREGEEACGGAIGEQCTFREAITAANGLPGADTISFAKLAAGSRLEVDEVGLPEITEQVTIAGDTAEGSTAGVPAIELFPVGLVDPEHTAGLGVHGGSKTRIEGLAIGEFGVGIEVAAIRGRRPADRNRNLRRLHGGRAERRDRGEPTGVGIAGEGGASRTAAGDRDRRPPGCAENVISGNSVGVSDCGLETTDRRQLDRARGRRRGTGERDGR